MKKGAYILDKKTRRKYFTQAIDRKKQLVKLREVGSFNTKLISFSAYKTHFIDEHEDMRNQFELFVVKQN